MWVYTYFHLDAASISLHSPHWLVQALIDKNSQSGQSPNSIAVLGEGKRQGRPTLAIINDGSPQLASIANHVIELNAATEQRVAATKTYTAELTVMAIFTAIPLGLQKVTLTF